MSSNSHVFLNYPKIRCALCECWIEIMEREKAPKEVQQPERVQRQRHWKDRQKVGNPEAQFSEWARARGLSNRKKARGQEGQNPTQEQ